MLKKFFLNYKNESHIFIFTFVTYIIIASLFIFNTKIFYNTNNTYDVLLDTDTGVLVEINTFVKNHDNSKHILFSPIVSVFAFPIYAISKIISLIGFNISNIYGIGLIFLQTIISSISITIMYSYLKEIIQNNKTLFLVMLIFIFSFPQLFMTLNVERFIYAQLSIVLFMYVVYKLEKKESYIIDMFAIPLFGITLTNIYLYAFYFFIKFKFDIKKYINHIAVFLVLSYIILVSSKSILSVIGIISIVEADTQFIATVTFYDKINMIFTRLLYPSMYFPGYDIVEYGRNGISHRMIQNSDINYIFMILLLIVLFICILSFIRNRNDIIVSLSFISILFNIFMHGIVGFNLKNANIMTIHFSFAIIVLLAHYCKQLDDKRIKCMNIFLSIFLFTMIISNIDGFLSIYKLGISILPR